MGMITKEIEYYKANRKDFIVLYDGQHLVIKGQQVIGVYKSHSEALNEATKLHETGTFIIERPMGLKVK